MGVVAAGEGRSQHTHQESRGMAEDESSGNWESGPTTDLWPCARGAVSNTTVRGGKGGTTNHGEHLLGGHKASE